jgi:TPR repeat protein
MKIIFKYILVFLFLTNILNAKVGNCQIGQGKEAFMACMVKQANSTNSVEDINLIAAIYVVDKQYVEGIKWYKKSAQQGDAKAAFFLGGIYDEALGIESDKFSDKVKTYLLGKDDKLIKNQKDAIKWYKKAAKADYDDAMPHMNEMMQKVYGKENTVKLYQKEIKENKDIYWNKQFLANFYFRLHDYKKRENILKELIKEYPEQKADWFTMIADAYTKNYMNNKEIEKKYYHIAAKHGSTNAMHNIGLDYGKQGDYKTAEKWFRKAGHDYMVCFMYKEILKDKTKAFECYEKEAKGNDLQSLYNLAYAYDKYDEDKLALDTFKKASELGSANATYAIGVLYEYSLDDKEKMMLWYKKAASMGNMKAIKFLNKKGKL